MLERPPGRLRSLNLVSTLRCNLRCMMCDIWKTKYEHLDMEDSVLQKIGCSDVVKDGYKTLGKDFNISVTGGEPFLSENLESVLSFIKETFPGNPYTITTNGTLTDKIIRAFSKFGVKGSRLHVSIDGMKDTHDLHRGMPGSFNKTMKTIKAVRKHFPWVRLKMKFTITKENLGEITDAYELSRQMGMEFGAKPVEVAIHYTNPGGKPGFGTSFSGPDRLVISEQLKKVASDCLRRGESANAAFFLDTIRYINKGRTIMDTCLSPLGTAFVMPNGDVFRCLHFNSVGNLAEGSFDDAWTSRTSMSVIESARKMDCGGCASFHGSYGNYADMFLHSIKNIFP
ncbi:MAG: hypothetical protein DRO99_03945 [Candidatus Aenigmatarchaeota archaeon]|nr:MAG: hypothetical protein DRO99_03945 [Candidatus Aenigmarchaeota archaeon]